MNQIILDEQGRIVVNDSMSDELKEKIAMYNSYEASDEDTEQYEVGSIDDDDDEDDEEESFDESSNIPVDESELNNLNDLFS